MLGMLPYGVGRNQGQHVQRSDVATAKDFDQEIYSRWIGDSLIRGPDKYASHRVVLDQQMQRRAVTGIIYVK